MNHRGIEGFPVLLDRIIVFSGFGSFRGFGIAFPVLVELGLDFDGILFEVGKTC